MKKCGVLLPIFSLPCEGGIGVLGESARGFVDFLSDAGQDYWQILPLSPADNTGSPYQSESAFAGDFVYIDLNGLRGDGLLEKDETLLPPAADRTRAERNENARLAALKAAYARFNGGDDYERFKKKESYWLDAYALYKALKERHGGACWTEWERRYALGDRAALDEFGRKNGREVEFYKFVQYEFSRQYSAVKEYANFKGVKMIGDMPIYVAFDSADVWSNRGCFMLGDDLKPTLVAGCPPDDFSEDGQLWGNPVYDWAQMGKSGYRWWLERFRRAADLYDCVRLDHFRGFESFYAVQYGEKTARQGQWLKACGRELFDRVKEEFPDLEIIAEDLGFITDEVRRLIKDAAYPNMKVMQFGLDGDRKNEHFPSNYKETSVAYTGTHDNDTLRSWYSSLGFIRRMKVRRLLGARMFEDINSAALRALYKSKTALAVLPLADCLAMREGRINTPGTVGAHNWSWRLAALPSAEAAERLRLAKEKYR